MAKVVFIDSSFFKGLIDPKDDFFERAGRIWVNLRNGETEALTSNYILDETLTLLRAKCNLETVLRFRDWLNDNSSLLKISRVTVRDEAGAWKWFVKDWNGLSFTDCVSFAVMERLKIVRVASFDKHFQRAGFRLEK